MPKKHGRYIPTDANLAKYGLTRDAYEALALAQGGLCAICRQRLIAAIDHCHRSGLVRGLLCRGCNVALGHARDNPQTLYNAAAYLRAHEDRDSPGEEEFYDPRVPRQPDDWTTGSPWPQMGYTVTCDSGEADGDSGAWVTVERGGDVVAEIGITVPPRIRATAEIWVRRKYRNELPVIDMGTFT